MAEEISLDEAANEARKFERFVQSFSKLATVINGAKHAVRLEAETKVRIDALKAEVDKVESLVVKAQNLEAEALVGIQVAKSKADAIINEAEAMSEKIISDAKSEAAKVIEEMAARKAAVESQVAAAVARREEAESAAKAAEQKAADAAAEYAKIRARASAI